MPTRVIAAIAVTLALAAVMHLDWHIARPATHHLSLGWRWHWLLAAPTFAALVWYVRRAWSGRTVAAGTLIIGGAAFVAAVVEPAWEYFVDGAPLEWAFGRLRFETFAAFLAAGTITYLLVMVGLRAPRH